MFPLLYFPAIAYVYKEKPNIIKTEGFLWSRITDSRRHQTPPTTRARGEGENGRVPLGYIMLPGAILSRAARQGPPPN